MRIAVLTRRYGYNFGSSLQAYAMRLLLESLGHKVEIINYDEFSQHVIWKVKPFIHSVVIPLICLLDKMGIQNNLVRKVKEEKLQKTKFQIFDRKYIMPSNKMLRTKHQLKVAMNNMDTCVCGSDQIWNPTGAYDSHYYLDFCKNEDIKKISYGSSFGVTKITKHKDEIAHYLQDFNSLSVREIQGKEIIEKITGRTDCTMVLDPTLMIHASIWRNKMKDCSVSLPAQYIACYFLGNKYIPYKFIIQISSLLNCPIVNITTFRTRNGIEGTQKKTLSPLEFLNVIDNAACILTDSFHATVFSILFQKNFYSFNKHNSISEANENSRLSSLLELMDLEDRYIVDNDADVLFYKDVCYEKTNRIMEEERTRSWNFLVEALSIR